MKYKRISILLFIAVFPFVGYAQNIGAQQVGFLENKGQIIDQHNEPNNDVLFLLPGNGANIQLKATGFAYDTYTTQVFEKPKEPEPWQMPDDMPDDSVVFYYHRIDVEWIGANSNPEIITHGKSTDYRNYYTTGTPQDGVKDVRHYQKVTCKNVWPEIDIEFVIGEKGPKYNFIIHPGGAIENIKWQYHGAETTLEDGRINIQTAQGVLTEEIPLSFYREGITEALVSFRHLGNQTFGLYCQNQQQHKTLVVDPVPELLWGTFFGGNGNFLDRLLTMERGGDNIYYAGSAEGTLYLATIGAFQDTIAGAEDAIVSCFTLNGSPAWITYYGGIYPDWFEDVRIVNEKIYLLGATDSDGLATNGVQQTTRGGNRDVLLSEFNTSGIRIWTSYFGGANNDRGEAITFANDTIFISGNTYSINNIVTTGVHQTVYGSLSDCFIAAFDTTGNRFWGSYFGGLGAEHTADIEVSNLNSQIYIAGRTSSPNNISSNNSYQNNMVGYSSAYVAQFSKSGSLNWATYYGKFDSFISDIDLFNGKVYVAGGTSVSTGNFNSMNCYNSALQDTTAAFITKFTDQGVLLDEIFINGDVEEGFTRIEIVDSSLIYFSGVATSTNLGSIQAIQPNLANNSRNSILGKIVNGNIVWLTYLGGLPFGSDMQDMEVWNDSIAISMDSSPNLPVKNAYQDTINGLYDAYLALFRDTCNPLTGINLGAIFGDSLVCPYDTVNYSISPKIGIENYQWSVPVGASIVSGQRSPCIRVAFDTTSGSVSLLTYNSCDSLPAVSKLITVSQPPAQPTISPVADTLYLCPNDSLTLSSDITSNIFWSTGDSACSIEIHAAGTYVLTHFDTTYCAKDARDSVWVLWHPTPDTPSVSPNGLQHICQGDALLLSAPASSQYLWSTGDTTQQIWVNQAGMYSLQVKDSLACWSFSSPQVQVVVDSSLSKPTINPPGPLTICQGDSLQLSAQGTGQQLWSTGSTASSIYAKTSGYYAVSAVDSQSVCPAVWSDSVFVTVVPLSNPPQITVLGNDTLCQGDSVQLSTNFAANNLWNTGDSTQTIWVSQSGNYYAFQLNALNCLSDTSNHMTIVVEPPVQKPTITANGATSFCQGDSVQLTANTSHPVIWNTTETTNPIWVKQPGIYFAQTNAQSACPDVYSDSVSIQVLPVPPAPTITATGDSAICNGNPVTLQSSQPTGNLWSTGDTTQSIAVSSPGTVKLWYSGTTGCTSDTAVFIVNQSTLDVGPDTEICAGDAITLNSSSSGNLMWSTGASGSSIVVSPASTATYWVRDLTTGCTDSIRVTVHPKPIAQFTVTPTQGPVPLTVQLTNTSSGATTYTWLFGDGSTSSQINPTHVYDVFGNYVIQLIATNALGCSDTAQSVVIDAIASNNIWIPNSFSPNGDGVNDFFEMQGIPEPYAFSVFDRWGNRVYYSNNYQNDWDGSYNGSILPVGAYTYMIEYQYINPNATQPDPNGSPQTLHGVLFVH